jgi:carbon-monoxide dehydrogenase iron sulfur subunit
MEKMLIVDADKCVGCSICELVCSMVKKGECNPKKSLIKVMRNREMDVNIPILSMECDFCGKCVESCLPEALSFVALPEAALIRKGAKIGKFPAPLFGRV